MWNRLTALFRRKRVALCLNSSFFGFYAHAGFVAGLEELGLEPAALSGASAGALIAGLRASGRSGREITELLARPDVERALPEPFWQSRIPGVLLGRPGRTGVFSGARFEALLREILGGRRIENCNPPLALSVANVTRAESQLAQKGPLVDFILASCAVPGMFAARQIRGELYWDGGVADPVPFEHWADDSRIDAVVAHLVITADELRARERTDFSLWSGLERCHQMIGDELMRLKAERVRRAGKSLYILRTIAPRPGPGRWSLGPRCIELGRETALREAPAAFAV